MRETRYRLNLPVSPMIHPISFRPREYEGKGIEVQFSLFCPVVDVFGGH